MKIFKSVLALSVLLTMLVACGDDSSSSASPEPIGDSSSSVVPASSDDDLSSGSQKSSGKEKSSSSVKSGNDSQKSSSSSDKKNNSSSSEGGENSSSSEVCVPNKRNDDGSIVVLERCCNGDTASFYDEDGAFVYYTCRAHMWLMDSIAGQDSIKPYVPHPNMEKQFASKIDYETFVDERDGQEYKIVTIKKHFDGAGDGVDEQYTFFAENLNLGKQILANATEFSDSVVEKVCYNDDEWYCDNGFGGFYSWSEAMNIPKKYDTAAVEKLDTTYYDNGKYVNRHIQGICPKGWHIMNENEWRFLGGGSQVNSRAVWGGSDYYGFSLLPAGYSVVGKFVLYGERACVWQPSSHKKNGTKEKATASFLYDDGIEWDMGIDRYAYLSVRCTKDY